VEILKNIKYNMTLDKKTFKYKKKNATSLFVEGRNYRNRFLLILLQGLKHDFFCSGQTGTDP
jgi:hypothetical protein